MSLLEKVQKVSCGISSYNFKNHIASDIAIGDSYLPAENVKSQGYLDSIQNRTDEKKMKLNQEKTKIIIFNYTRDYQFSLRLYIQGSLLEIVEETKLLGSVISTDLTWWRNTNYLTKKGYQRLEILRKLYEFNVPIDDLVHIYTLYTRSILEFNCCVWNFSITQEESSDIERVQKIACRIILKDKYLSYENALSTLNLQTLSERRVMLCIRFAQNCLKHDKSKSMFPLDQDRNRDKFKVNFAKHSRLLFSAIPQMQRLLNNQ